MSIKIGNEEIGEISEFCYLGSEITRDGRCDADIRTLKISSKDRSLIRARLRSLQRARVEVKSKEKVSFL